MKLSEIKEILPMLNNVEFQLENRAFLPGHFHVTEAGKSSKKLLVHSKEKSHVVHNHRW